MIAGLQIQDALLPNMTEVQMPQRARSKGRIRQFCCFLLILWAIGAGICSAQSHGSGKNLVYVGTYTNHGSKGVYAYTFDSKKGALTSIGLVAETESPAFIALDPRRNFLYAANEIPNYKDQATGAVSSFAIDLASGKLSLLNQVSSRTPGPAYITVDRSGKYVLIANYPVGSVAVFPVLGDGRLGEPSAFVQHQGSSVNKDRQSGPHAHVIELSPDNRFALVADLGTDQLLVYPFDESKGTLGEARITKIDPGSGPRHVRFSPDGKFVYLLNEMQPNVTVFSYDAVYGGLSALQTISTLPKDFTGKKSAAEIQIHPSGKFLYASNRGHDSIAVFAVDKSKGTLTLVEHVPTQGKTPRNFAIDPSGSWLLAANQDSDDIVVFHVNPTTGRLSPAAGIVQVPTPVCITFDAITMPAGR
jgi:6-phosphogluconolactonase